MTSTHGDVTHPQRWAVVGGGMVGMTLAHRLAQAGQLVVLFEGAPRLGGLADSWELGDIVWDRHYHVTLLTDTRLRSLLGELGLEQDINWVETRSGCLMDGTIHPVSNAIDLLRFPPLALIDRLRLGATVAYGAHIRNGRRLEAITVADWLTRWSGQAAFDRLWRPLLQAKLGQTYEQTSAAFIWTVIQRLYRARRTGLKREMFGYVTGGYARIIEQFSALLADQGVAVELGRPVERITADVDGGDELHVGLHGGKVLTFDKVVVTAVPSVAVRLCPGLTRGERDQMTAMPYVGIVCASLLLDRPLSDRYLTYLAEEAPFSAIVEMSALVDPAQLGGHALVYLPRYLAPDDPFLSASDEEVKDAFLGGLAQVLPSFRPCGLLAFRVSRVRQVFAVPTLGYSKRLPAASTSVPGLCMVNSSQILDGTLNVNESIELAERTSAELLGDLGASR